MTSKIAAIANYAHQVFHNISSNSLASLMALAANGCANHIINPLCNSGGSNRGSLPPNQFLNGSSNVSSSLGSTTMTVSTTNFVNSSSSTSNSSSANTSRNSHSQHVQTSHAATNSSTTPSSHSLTSECNSSQSNVTAKEQLLSELISKMGSLTKKDVGFDHAWVTDTARYPSPIVYVHIAENQVFSLGIFVLRAGSRIPLHDHPGMFGLIKVLHGSLRCRSYSKAPCGSVPLSRSIPTMSSSTAVNSSSGFISPSGDRTVSSASAGSTSSLLRWQMKDVFAVKPHQDVILNADSGVCVLTPHVGNYHEIYPVGNEGAAFIDILAPPYDMDLGTRECHFYEVVDNLPQGGAAGRSVSESMPTSQLETSRDHSIYDHHFTNSSGDDNFPPTYLREIPTPKDYICEAAEYRGPSVD